MKNFIRHSESNNRCNLCIKIFTGNAETVENDIQTFLNAEPVEIETVKQSESFGEGVTYITITIFYYSEGTAQFIDEQLSTHLLAGKLLDEIETYYDITFDDILNTIDNKHKKET